MALPPHEMLDELLAGRAFTPSNLDALLQEHPREGPFLEYKDGLLLANDRTRAAAELRRGASAFANSEGGIFIFGVAEPTADQPRRISPCAPPGGQPVDEWARNVLQDMTPFFSPQPRLQVVPHPDGSVLVIAIPRAPQLVPCVESRQLKYFLRIHDSTVEAPAYLLSDLVLGRRHHPVLDIHVHQVDVETGYVAPIGGACNANRASLTFQFVVDSLSLTVAPDVRVGIVCWRVDDTTKALPRQLLSYVDAQQPECPQPFRWNLVHLKNDLGQLLPFDEIRSSPLAGLVVPAYPQLATIRCAVYVLPRGSSPTWFQLEYRYDTELRRKLPQERVSAATLKRLGSQRPVLSWTLDVPSDAAGSSTNGPSA